MRYRMLSLLLILTLLLGACTGNDDRPGRDDDEDERVEDREDDISGDETGETEPPSYTVADITFQYETDDSKEFAIITAFDAEGNMVWETESRHYDVAQLTSVTAIGIWEDRYYYVEGGSVVALDRDSGEKLWENPDFGGYPASSNSCMIFPDGTVFATGYFGPDFAVIDKDGNMRKRIEMIDNDIYWPHEVQTEDGLVVITFEGGPEGDGTYRFTIDPETWEVVE